MDETLWVSMNGAKQALDLQTLYAGNLANAKTTGFQADLVKAQSVSLEGEKWDSSQVYVNGGQVIPDTSPGAIISTGRELDVAVDGQGYFTVQAPDGSEAYTRSGEFQVNANGMLMNGRGNPVMGNGGPISLPPYSKVEIASDGTISVIPKGQSGKTPVLVDRLKLVKPDPNNLIKTKDGLLKTQDGKPAEPDSAIHVSSGALNASNVNAVGTMVDMISAARQFEMHMRIMQEVKSESQAAAQLLQLS